MRKLWRLWCFLFGCQAKGRHHVGKYLNGYRYRPNCDRCGERMENWP